MLVRVYIYKNDKGKERLDKVVPFIGVKFAKSWLKSHGFRRTYDDVYLCYNDPRFHATMAESDR